MFLDIVIIIIKIAVVVGVAMLHVMYATWAERKSIGRMQVRMGPMEVGFHGLLQPIADGVKLFFKEDIIPANADKPVFYVSPVIIMMSTLVSLSVIPFFDGFVVANINIGLLFILAMSSIGAYGIVLAGWSSNSKYPFLGGLRASAQVISYEVAMGLSLVGVMIMAGSLNLQDIVKAQAAYPTGMYVVPQIIAFFVFVVSALAETNRTPFDMPEAENELVAGYFTEYSGIRFALFFLGEYVGMIVMACMAVVCFLGGWTLPPFIVKIVPFVESVPFIGLFIFLAKLYVCIFFYYWIRATVPRYRYDQVMALGWKLLIPLALLNILITGVIKILA
ncbi:MAG: NADH-quinone oxidoreductase subunit NuoH [Nitrospirota bacterium]|nr:MAG: NADH-quinone oxidoreductase subunit NuoH [Nitrospirota bacterium]